jgi:hypothetical protein
MAATVGVPTSPKKPYWLLPLVGLRLVAMFVIASPAWLSVVVSADVEWQGNTLIA